MKDQDRKFYRAQNVVEKLSQELKEFVPNPEVFEHDMDLREEKEKQRSALIRLRELSQERVLFYMRHFNKIQLTVLYQFQIPLEEHISDIFGIKVYFHRYLTVMPDEYHTLV